MIVDRCFRIGDFHGTDSWSKKDSSGKEESSKGEPILFSQYSRSAFPTKLPWSNQRQRGHGEKGGWLWLLIRSRLRPRGNQIGLMCSSARGKEENRKVHTPSPSVTDGKAPAREWSCRFRLSQSAQAVGSSRTDRKVGTRKSLGQAFQKTRTGESSIPHGFLSRA